MAVNARRLFVRYSAAMACATMLSVIVLPLFAPCIAHAQATVKIVGAGVSFVPPKGYQSIKNPAPTDFSCTGKVTGGYPLRISVLRKPVVPGEENNAAAVRRLVYHNKDTAPTYKTVATGTTKVGGVPAAFVTGAFTTTWGTKIKTKSILVTRGRQVYSFTFGAAAVTFNKQVGAFDKMAASIKWL